MHFSSVFCVLAMAIVLEQCSHTNADKKHCDYTMAKEIDCMASGKQVIDVMMSATCKPHDRHVALKAMPLYEFVPSVVSIKRCDGHCPGHTCMPIMKRLTKVPVRQIHNKQDGKRRTTCAFVDVEEHTKCKCMCKHKEEDCNKDQDWVSNRCACVCKDQEAKKMKCEATMGMLWDDEDCSCTCTERDLGCTTGLQWSREKCDCILMPSH